MAWYDCLQGGGSNGFLPSIEDDKGLLIRRIGESAVYSLYDTLPNDSASAWGKGSNTGTWVVFANVKNKSKVYRSSSSYAPICGGLNISGNTFTCTDIPFSNNIADCSAYDYVIVQSTNATANNNVWFE